MTLDLTPHLAAIAQREAVAGEDVRTAALRLNAGAGLIVRTRHDIPVTLPGVTFVPDPVDEDEADEIDADVSLVIHRDDPAATALDIETRMADGQRVALVDQRYPDHGDPALMKALLASTVYVGSLAAYDLDVERALLMVMTPLRNGQAFRLTVAHSVLYWWAWQAIVRPEIVRRFGEQIDPALLAKAQAHARTRLGAHLLPLHRRGLRYFIGSITFDDDHVDGFRLGLIPAR